MSSTLCLNDGAFGPGVRGCRGDFDFTQKFERIFLSIIPAAVFVAAALARVAVLAQRKRVVGGVILQYLKLAFITVYALIQFSLLVILATGAPGVVHGLSIAASALVFLASLSALVLSFIEHARAQRPSTLLNVYILLTLLFDIVQARTAWLIIANRHQSLLARLFTSSVAVKVVILCLEAIPKTKWIYWDAREHSPEESSSVFSLGVYYWLNRLFWRGYKGVMDIEDLYPLDASMSAEKLHRRLSDKLQIQKYRVDSKFGLVKDLCRALAGPFLAPVAPRIALIAFKFCQPFFIDATLDYLQDESQRKSLGYGLLGACVLIYVGIAISSGFYGYYNQKAIFMVRGCLASAVYRKTTRSRLAAANDSAAVTLMSTDIEHILQGGQFIHEVWANIIEVAIGCWLLQGKIGTAFIAPLIVIAVCGGILIWVLTVVGKRQREWMARIQNRVGLTANAIAHMKLYKISGITSPVADLIQTLRLGEIKIGNQFRWLLIVGVVLGISPITLSPVITFAFASHSLSVSTMFTSVSYIILLTLPLLYMFQNLPLIFAAWTCTRRIQDFLLSEPRTDFRRRLGSQSLGEETEKSDLTPNIQDALAFSVENGSFGWGGEKMTLNQMTASIPAQKLTLVIGPVASGKSTFCKVLLGDVPASSGTVTAFFPPSRIGYCEQTPFLYNTSLKENIIGHSLFDQKKYDDIIEATLLGSDVALLPQGHDTQIGSNGIMLSGGQKQRVSVARALYSEADVMIFDDVLSGLDNDTEAELFRRCFGPDGITQRRKVTVIICTHSIRHLPTADHIIALGFDGTVVEEGPFEYLASNKKYVQSLGVKSGGTNTPVESDDEAAPEAIPAPKPTSNAMKEALDDRSRQLGEWSTYKHYFSSVNPLQVAFVVFTGLLFGACDNMSTVWLKFWSEDTFGRSNAFYIGIYGFIRVLQVVSVLANAVTAVICMVSGSGSLLHKRAITTVVRAPLRFFSTTDSGVVLNLFSQDMTLLDGELPVAVFNVTIDLSDTLGIAFVIASAAPYIAAGYPILFAILFFLQKFYLRTSRQVRLLDLEAKSPLYTHFIDTIKGVATIRAFGWEDADIARNNVLLDTSQRPAYLLAMIQQWLLTTLQLIVAGIAVVLIALATHLGANTGLTGASLVTLLTFSTAISSLIRSYTQLETSLGAVSRLKTFSDTVMPEDQPGEDFEPPSDWPHRGRIELRDISASYDTEPGAQTTPPRQIPSLVLRNITLSIEAGEKVAICGRTGSGKSTLILLLLRLLDPLPSCARNIEMDGIPLHMIDRATLRKRIIAIPQDAVFLPDGSSIRANIDPLQVATEEECLAVLETVQLGGFVGDRGGLHAGMSADDLSAGQKQLFSLGRAMVRKRVRDREGGEKAGGVLLLDEVSSSVDKVTDRTMQEIIREEFAGYTIVMVSHRLEMVVDFFDRVVVLDKGAVVEQGKPQELIVREGSRFGELWTIGNHGR